ncbi:MAG: hypothetical protein ACREQC_07085, partial [Candidatus Binataceae bacterium]
MIKGLHDADQLVRTYSGHALVNTGPPAIAALAPIVKNPHFDADVAWSQQVILVLGQMARREPDAQLLLISTFRSERQPFAASQLGQAGAPAVPALRRALKDDDARIRHV